MTMQTDVKAKSITGTVALGIGPCRIKAIYVNATTGGTLGVADSANTLISMVFPTIGATTPFYMLLPGEGVYFKSDPTATYTTLVGNVTFFYG